MIVWAMLTFVLGFLTNYIINKLYKKNRNEILSLFIFWFHNMLNNLDDIIAFSSAIIFVVCTIYDCTHKNSDISIQYLSIFSTLIFSWLLTKKSTEIQCKKEQERVSKVSYRHLSDIEYSVLTAEQYVKDCLLDDELGTSQKDVLERVKDKILSIKQGLDTNKEDWYDFLDETYKKEMDDKAKNHEENPPANIINKNMDIKTIFLDDVKKMQK